MVPLAQRFEGAEMKRARQMKIKPKGSKLFTPKYNLAQTYAKR